MAGILIGGSIVKRHMHVLLTESGGIRGSLCFWNRRLRCTISLGIISMLWARFEDSNVSVELQIYYRSTKGERIDKWIEYFCQKDVDRR